MLQNTLQANTCIRQLAGQELVPIMTLSMTMFVNLNRLVIHKQYMTIVTTAANGVAE